jgi:hypothetical protein
MTEAEAFELTLLASANTVTSFTVYITFTFGFLAAAFFVGKQLTRPQAVIVSALYTFAALSAFINVLSDLEFYAAAISHMSDPVSQGGINTPEFWRAYMSILLGAGIVASLYFMWSIRRDGEDE